MSNHNYMPKGKCVGLGNRGGQSWGMYRELEPRCKGEYVQFVTWCHGVRNSE